MKNKLRFGIVGIGMYAYRVHAQALLQSSRAQLVAVVRRDEARLRAAQRHLGVELAYTDWRQMLDEAPLDGVIVCTAHAAHREPALAALDKGLHVLVEKPIAATQADARIIAAAARQSNRVLMVSYQLRLNALFRAIHHAISEGEIGTVRQISVVFSQPFLMPTGENLDKIASHYIASGVPADFVYGDGLKPTWRSVPGEVGGGMFADTGSHFADLAIWLAGGGNPVEVYSVSEPARSDVEKYMNVQVRLDNGVLVSLMANAHTHGLTARSSGQITVLGDDGWLLCDMREAWISKGGSRKAISPAGKDLPAVEGFVSAILQEAPNPCPAEEASRVVAVTEAAYESARSGEPIRFI